MKVWQGYGSEHSMNLVMVGTFKTEADANKVREAIQQITRQVDIAVDKGILEVGENNREFGEDLRQLLHQLNLYILNPHEMEQFRYDVSLEAKDRCLVLTTDEIDVSAFMKIFVDKGAGWSPLSGPAESRGKALGYATTFNSAC
ncbi:DUF6375 family protein [Deinococcus peraridilitoris]|uniref:Uncharacterized protein n=1 Tax=Deinococcus peraridilitoris (strain DSM 19664 / LMG 22246 / CIP 109416 / KR-200) TaxID=937777 RepID=L0A7K0_DEIPD|nr:DUF6375 family protein [Deinococcus peraridilitoris]AFZ69429.1 hypothetical protein Deipe_4040 [Deinococcus peraridilitoris DSM 19664]